MNFKTNILCVCFLLLGMLIASIALRAKSKETHSLTYVTHLDAAATVGRAGFQLYDSVCVCSKGNDTTALVCKKDINGHLYYVTTLQRSEAIFKADIGRQIATLEAQ